MGKVVITLIASVLLTGCFTKTTIKYVSVPIPTPPEVARPTLKLYEINEHTPDNDVVKYYRISVEQLINYSTSLEMIVNKYKELSKNQ